MIHGKAQIRSQCIERTQNLTRCRNRSVHLCAQKRTQTLEGIGVKAQIGLQWTGFQTTCTKAERHPGAGGEVRTAELLKLQQS